MGKQDNIFRNFDWRNMDWDVSKMWSEFKIPTVDIDALVAAQQKNFEALTAANKLAVEGFQAIAKRQAELVREAFEHGVKATEILAASKTPEDRLLKQADLSKEAIETSLANVRELTVLWTKSADKTVDVVASRMAESFDEAKGWFGKAPVARHAAAAE
jgi:phasin family protein